MIRSGLTLATFVTLSLLPLRATRAAEPDARPPSVAAVLDQYAATQKALERCTQVTDARTDFYLGDDLYVHIRQRGEYRRDGGRAFCSSSEKRADSFKPMPEALPPLPAPAASDPRFESIESSLATAEGITTYFHYPQNPAGGQVVLDVVEDGAERLQLLPNDRIGCWLRGWLFDDRKRLDQILRDAGAAARSRPDDVDGRTCTLVEADTPGGHYAVWFDTSRGGNILRARVRSGPHDVTRNGEVWAAARGGRERPEKVPYGPEDEKSRMTTTLDDVSLERVGDLWLPVSATLVGETVGRGRRTRVESHYTTRWDLSPRFGADAFVLDIPDGVKVVLRAGNAIANPPLEWRNGHAVPAAAPR